MFMKNNACMKSTNAENNLILEEVTVLVKGNVMQFSDSSAV